MVEPGLAVTAEPVVALRPVPGDQVNVVAPEAVRVVDVPEQIVGEFTVTVGVGFTVTVITTGAPGQPATEGVTV
jgi:hypothetical protein